MLEDERLTGNPENGNGPFQSKVTITADVVLTDPLAGLVTVPLDGFTETSMS